IHEVGSGGFWVRQRTEDGSNAVINAKSSSQQGIQLSGVSVFRVDDAHHYLARIEAKSAGLDPGFWGLGEGGRYGREAPTADPEGYNLKTNLTPVSVRENFATPDTVPFWQLSAYINMAENARSAAAGYRVQYYQLLAQPFYLAAMVLLAASVSLRSFRF